MNDTKTLLINHQDRVVFLYSCSALGGILCIFYTLLNGASLYSFNVKEQGLTNLVNWLITSEITIYHSFTTLFRHFVDTLTGTEQFPKIRLVKLGGEATLIRDVENYKKYFSSDCLLYASLGATEAGTFRNFIVDKDTKIENSIVPIGYAVEDMEVVLLDEAGVEVKNGNIGEITLKSEYLALGYWQKPELTQAVFLPDIQNSQKRIYRTGDLGCIQADGCLIHKGRKDFQVKIRGFRIEVAEIEMELLKISNIKEAVVIASEDSPEDKRLIAYIVPQQKPAPTTKEIRQYLQNKLPEYTKQVCNHYFPTGSHVILPEDKKYLEISNAHKQALNTYVFRPYAGKLTLFRTRDENRTEAIGLEYDSHFGWGEIVMGDLDIKYIPGSHLSLLNEPNVRVLAKQVKICLEKAQNVTYTANGS
jgi:acyl-coenzyme A synthetase/AMP-(fatty) acid ligase